MGMMLISNQTAYLLEYRIFSNNSWGRLFLSRTKKVAIIRGRRLFRGLLTNIRALGHWGKFRRGSKNVLQLKLQIVMFLNDKLYISCQSFVRGKFILHISSIILAEIKITKTSFYSTKWYIINLKATSCRRKAVTRAKGFPSPYNPTLPPSLSLNYPFIIIAWL